MLRLILLGKTGVGKSLTGNTIFGGKRCFRDACSGSSITKTCECHTENIHGRSITVVDTPGIFDTYGDIDMVNVTEEAKGMVQPGPHAVLLVVRIGRFTREDLEALKESKMLVGEKALRHAILLFTFYDDWKRDFKSSGSFKSYISDLPIELQRFITAECGNRYVLFDNTLEGEEAEKQVKDLFKCIDQMIQNDESNFIPNQNILPNLTSKVSTSQAGIDKDKHKKELSELQQRLNKERDLQIQCILNREERSVSGLDIARGVVNVASFMTRLYFAWNGYPEPTGNGFFLTPNGIVYRNSW